MAKYLSHNAGRIQEVAAINTSAGAGDAGKIPELDGSGRLDTTMMPVGFGDDVSTMTASENLAAGDLINVHDSTGPKIRKADATTSGKEANGFVLQAITAATSGTVHWEGNITGLSSLTVGARYYLNTTAGAITTTPPSGAGNVVQYIGTAISATELTFEADDGIILA